jgi:hypothetical protein
VLHDLRLPAAGHPARCGRDIRARITMTKNTTTTAASAPTATHQPTGNGEQIATPAKRRRGPNKPKPELIQVSTEATINTAAILKLLTDYAAKMVGADVAAGMELQVHAGQGGGWEASSDSGYVVRFATKGSKGSR